MGILAGPLRGRPADPGSETTFFSLRVEEFGSYLFAEKLLASSELRIREVGDFGPKSADSGPRKPIIFEKNFRKKYFAPNQLPNA